MSPTRMPVRDRNSASAGDGSDEPDAHEDLGRGGRGVRRLIAHEPDELLDSKRIREDGC